MHFSMKCEFKNAQIPAWIFECGIYFRVHYVESTSSTSLLLLKTSLLLLTPQPVPFDILAVPAFAVIQVLRFFVILFPYAVAVYKVNTLKCVH